MNNAKADSVKSRLLNRSRSSTEDFNTILRRYVGLRFLHRIAASDHVESFVLKGAQLYLFWTPTSQRPTRDIDFLSLATHDGATFQTVLQSICRIDLEPDGLIFDPQSITVENIRPGAESGGFRCHLEAALGTARQRLQVDVGFGDSISLAPRWVEIPRLLEDETRRSIRAYRMETAIAEKLEAIVTLGLTNSRLKDYYDLDVFLRELETNRVELAKAIADTFHRRSTPIPESIPIGLTESFWSLPSAQAQWKTFGGKNQLPTDALEHICERIWSRLEEPVAFARTLKPERD